MEHIPDDRGALDELVRVLRPGGVHGRHRSRVVAREGLLDAVRRVLRAEGRRRPRPHLHRGRTALEDERAPGSSRDRSHQAHALHTPYWWLKCAVGPDNDDFPLVKLYNRFLVWDIEQRPAVTRVAEQVLNPVLGKSLVVYATKPVDRASDRTSAPPDRGRSARASA